MKKLLAPYNCKSLQLKNHIVMAPMTRSRAIGNVPNALMAEYYGQRSGAGLIVTEGTAPAPEALGYARMPGIFSHAQIEGWKPVTAEVHRAGAKFFLQLMHPGRIGHVANLPEGVRLAGASALPAKGQIYTDALGAQDYSTPDTLTIEGVQKVIGSFVSGARNAIAAGFDGVEVHGANGYLIEQFLNPNVNDRTDQFGGSMENRARFALEVVKHVSGEIGRDKVGIRFSPNSTLGDLQPYDPEVTMDTYRYLARQLKAIGIAYMHVAISQETPAAMLDAIRREFKGTLIHCNGFTPETAEIELQKGKADLIAFGRNFLANPDFVERISADASLNEVDYTTLYSPGEKGYVDYPKMTKMVRK
ncbi:alkene reductase [Puia dinghuensis]|uniref:Alkene reductase n=1 Tax=Puia dinghuensis TaxID=1792502 RepID=A0A8J2XST9_9BACT|nr:alkene reductase [Puia dinghuensis]GGA97721.1 alkene reductase [Puia dinghuensis]